MNTKEAVKDYRLLTYDLAKIIGRLKLIKDRVEYINQKMEWDGMFEISFSSAMENLADVQAAMTVYAWEDEYRDRDIRSTKSELDVLTNISKEDDDENA